ncbi:hypothetical protein ACJJTC_011628 [Scirpophaga incertulas]
MAHLEGILEGQKSLEEKVNKKMEELQQQLLNAGSHKDTVAKVAEEFRTFRELIFNMIGLLRNQIEECVKHIELFENRHRQKALVFMGIPEVEKESCSGTLLVAQSEAGRPGVGMFSRSTTKWLERDQTVLGSGLSRTDDP